MTAPEIADLCLYSFLINTGMLTLWFVMLMTMGDWIYRVHSKLFPISRETFNAIHYSGMALYKLSLFFFNLVPWIALRIVIDT